MIFITSFLAVTFMLLRTERFLGGGGIYYLASFGLILFSEAIILILKRKKYLTDNKVINILHSLLMLMIVKNFIQFEIALLHDDSLVIIKKGIWGNILQIVAFYVGLLFGKYISDRCFKVLSILSVTVIVPISTILISLGEAKNGSRFILTIGNFSIVSLAVYSLLLPFVTSAFLDATPFKKELASSSSRDIQLRHFATITYSLIVGAAMVINRDLGTFLIYASSTLICILPTLKKTWHKVVLCFSSFMGILALYHNSYTFRSRINELFFKTAIDESESLYFSQSYARSGWWGQGTYSISLGAIRFPEDYLLQAIWSSHGLVFMAGTVIISAIILITLTRMRDSMHHSSYWSTVSLSIILILTIPCVYTCGMTLLLFPVTGVPAILLGNGLSINAVYTFLIAMYIAIYEKFKKGEL